MPTRISELTSQRTITAPRATGGNGRCRAQSGRWEIANVDKCHKPRSVPDILSCASILKPTSQRSRPCSTLSQHLLTGLSVSRLFELAQDFRGLLELRRITPFRKPVADRS
jgi:hypothetical protein